MSTYEAARISTNKTIIIGNGWNNNIINTTIYHNHGNITVGNYQYLAFFIDTK